MYCFLRVGGVLQFSIGDEVMMVPLANEWMCDPSTCVCAAKHGDQQTSQGCQSLSSCFHSAEKGVQVNVSCGANKNN